MNDLIFIGLPFCWTLFKTKNNVKDAFFVSRGRCCLWANKSTCRSSSLYDAISPFFPHWTFVNHSVVVGKFFEAHRPEKSQPKTVLATLSISSILSFSGQSVNSTKLLLSQVGTQLCPQISFNQWCNCACPLEADQLLNKKVTWDVPIVVADLQVVM